MNQPELRIRMSRSGRANTVVLVLHGGQATSSAPVRSTQLAYRRMFPLASVAHRAAAHLDTAVWLLRNRVRGWNAPQLDPIVDARWALDIVRETHPQARIALIGHSMGGRAALRLAGEPGVRAVCALAPWTEDTDPVRQLGGRAVLIVHGDRDRTTPSLSSLAFARRAREEGIEVKRNVVNGSGHGMLRRYRKWNDQVRRFTLDCANAAAEETR